MSIFSNAGSMVTAALKDVGIVSEGEVATGEQANAGILALNLVLDELSIDRSMVSALVEETFALTIGTASYEVKSGSVTGWNTTPPQKIEDCFLRDAAGLDWHVSCDMTDKEYNAIPLKTLSSVPSRLLYNSTRPTAYIYFDVAPAVAYTAHFFSWKNLAAIPLASATTIVWPMGYESAIFLHLKIRLATSPAYNIPVSPILLRDAATAKQNLAALNATPVRKKLGIPLPKRGGISRSQFDSGDF